MEFVSYEEYVEYIRPDNKPKEIEILEKTHIFDTQTLFQLKVVMYKRISDGMFMVYQAVQYGNHKPFKQHYEFKMYWDAYNKYQKLGGK